MPRSMYICYEKKDFKNVWLIAWEKGKGDEKGKMEFLYEETTAYVRRERESKSGFTATETAAFEISSSSNWTGTKS
ncbi:hypothetical protein KPH14_002302 [Odynerus spinipes]|uniref:Uncharacterized protein n=1 Tax=Odynerus spinipes TaxID=1348599 RepID=A0AAD9VP15_9HYME|nr:hypothetical protein KPH14_002302 [Odynerus spinipes]